MNFSKQGFVYVQTPIITGNDPGRCGNLFRVTTIDNQEFEKDFLVKKLV